MDDPATPMTPTRRKKDGGDAKDSPRKRQCVCASTLTNDRLSFQSDVVC